MRGGTELGRGEGTGNPAGPWRMAVLVGVATVAVFLLAGAIGILHGVSASVAQSAGRAAGTGLRDSAVTAPTNSCPSSGPLGGLNTGETVGLLVIIAIAGIGGGIVIGRFLNPQPLPPGVYMPRSGPSAGAAGKAPEPPDPAVRAAAARKAGGGNTPGQESESAGAGAGSVREDTWTEGGKTAGDDIARESKD